MNYCKEIEKIAENYYIAYKYWNQKRIYRLKKTPQDFLNYLKDLDDEQSSPNFPLHLNSSYDYVKYLLHDLLDLMEHRYKYYLKHGNTKKLITSYRQLNLIPYKRRLNICYNYDFDIEN